MLTYLPQVAMSILYRRYQALQQQDSEGANRGDASSGASAQSNGSRRPPRHAQRPGADGRRKKI